MDKQKELIRITSEYFENNLDYSKLLHTTKEYKNFLNELCGKEFDNENGRNDIHFENGKALGTLWAAMCIDDLIRTRQFIRGIDKAIKEKMDNKASIHILYAGTGPFASLLLPLILRYSKRKIKYTLLEINPFSFETLQKVISKLELKDYNIKLLNEDATKYQITEDTPDIIISETMQNALAKEQQVSIFVNLMRQVKFDSIFIPEKIELFIGLKKAGILTEELQRKHYHKVEKIFELSKEALISTQQIKAQTTEKMTFPKTTIILTKERLDGFNQLVLITEIQVFKNEKIRMNESGLTVPLTIKDISNDLNDSLTINTQYKISDEPKLYYDIA